MLYQNKTLFNGIIGYTVIDIQQVAILLRTLAEYAVNLENRPYFKVVAFENYRAECNPTWQS